MTESCTAGIGSTTASSPSRDEKCRSRSATCFSSVISSTRRRVRPSASRCWERIIASRSTGAPMDSLRRGVVLIAYTVCSAISAICPTLPCPPGLLDTFEAALEDDLNFAGAIAELFRMAKAARRATTAADRAAYRAALRGAGGLLGLLQQDPAAWFEQPSGEDVDTAGIQRLVEARRAARSVRDYATADRIRDELACPRRRGSGSGRWPGLAENRIGQSRDVPTAFNPCQRP